MWKLLLLVAVFAIGAEARNMRGQPNPIHELMVDYCTENGQADKVDEAESGFWEFAGCVHAELGVEFEKEMTEALPNGVSAIKQVTQKYCTRTPRFKTCVHTFTSKMAKCMDAELKDNITLVNTLLDEMIDFGCYNGGERIARFIGEGGIQCAHEHELALDACHTGLTKAAKKTIRDQTTCNKFDAYATCLNRALSSCSTTIAKEIVTSLMAQLRQHLSC